MLKTNVDNEQKLNYLNYLFDNIPGIKQWSVDQEDIDKVLRIEASEKITEPDIIALLNKENILCEELI